MYGLPIEPAAKKPGAGLCCVALRCLLRFSHNAYRGRSTVLFHPCPKPVDYFDAMLIFLEQAIAAHFCNAEATAIFGCEIKHGLHGQAQRRLKERGPAAIHGGLTRFRS